MDGTLVPLRFTNDSNRPLDQLDRNIGNTKDDRNHNTMQGVSMKTYCLSLSFFVVGMSVLYSPVFAEGKVVKTIAAENVVYMKCAKEDKSFLLSHFLVIEGKPPTAHAASWPALSTTQMVRQGDVTYYLEKGSVT